MDHLPHPSEPYRPILVPFLCSRVPYSPPFEDFPQRHNCSLAGGMRPSLEGPSLMDVASVAQSWLFFGLLEEFLGLLDIEFNIDDFLCDSEGHCKEEPDGLEQNWVKDEVIVLYSPHHQPETCTQAPRHYWKGISTAAAAAEDNLETTHPRYVTTKRLWWYLHAAIQKLQETCATDEQHAALMRTRFDDFEKKLLLAGSVISGINNLDTTALNEDQVDTFAGIDLSLRSLRETLVEVGSAVPERRRGIEITHHSHQIYHWMLRRGSCKYHAFWVVNHFSAQSAYYISLLWSPRPPISPCPNETPIQSHAECSSAQCCFLQLDESGYEVKHQPECDDCRMLAPDIGEVSRILGEGGIPLLRIRTQSIYQSGTDETAQKSPIDVQGSLVLDVKPYKEGLMFCAISHVWSDGRGNPYANALPECQLRAMSSAAILAKQGQYAKDGLHVEGEADVAEVLIWIDTLCIPLIKDPRKQAIQRLKETYALSASVLVLDSGLETSKKQDRTTLELGYRIVSCNWQRRMWTLQEAVFAQKLAFKFADGLVFMEDLHLDEMGDHITSVHMDLRMKLGYLCSGRSYRADTSGELNQTARVDRLLDTVTNISHRTTSKRTDEPICLATLLDADVRVLLEMPERDRMRYILNHQKGFVPSIIFINGPKMQESPYRWAPSTFLYTPWHRMQIAAGFSMQPYANHPTGQAGGLLMATMTRDGLILDLPGLLICPPATLAEAASFSEFLAVDHSTRPTRILLVRTVCEDGGYSGPSRPVITFRNTGTTATEAGSSETVLESPGEGGSKEELLATHAILLMASLDAPMPGYRHLRPRNILGLVISDVKQSTINSTNQASKKVMLVAGRCEARVDVLDLSREPEMMRRYSREITDDEGNVIGRAVGGPIFRGMMAPGVPKWCIR
jgi:hypothetical protein